MCIDKRFDWQFILDKSVEILKASKRPMKGKEIAKKLCEENIPIHKSPLNRIIYKFPDSLYADEDGYWYLAKTSHANTVSYDELV